MATELISKSTAGVAGNDYSYNSSISAIGRYITYQSDADNLVTGDTNGVSDIFVFDTTTGTTTRVSTHSNGTQSNGTSSNPFISVHGHTITYESLASNLVAGDTNSVSDIFVFDMATGTTTRASTHSDGTEGNSTSYNPTVSADGHTITYESVASNLVAGDTNGAWDIFARDTVTGTTTRVSTHSDGTEGNSSSYTPSISADGQTITYYSWANNLINGDTNGLLDIFMFDTTTGTTTRVST